VEAQKMGSVFNYDKAKNIENVKPTKEKGIRINNRDIEKVNQLIYLGSNITPLCFINCDQTMPAVQ
jgi:hypothetical protein